jgi:hypothetical protein
MAGTATAPRVRRFTYTPLDPGDRHEVKVHGVTFKANVPVELDDQKHRAHIMETVTVGERDGRALTEGRMVYRPLADLLAGNKTFVEEGADRPKPGRPPTPKTAEEYRAHAVRWINAAPNATTMLERWKAEADLRASCDASDAIAEDIWSNVYLPRKHVLDNQPPD